MKTTINLSDELIEQASKYTGIQEKTKLIHLALETLIQEASRKQLVRLFGSDKKASIAPRKRN
jgi:Arc/MetJ family transcription regulator